MLDSLVKVTLPEMGESVTEGSIVEWRKKVGQWVDEGDTIVDVTTDKVDVEVPSTASGVITALHGAEGDTVAVGTVLVEIDTSAAKPAADAAAPAPHPPPAKPELVTPSSYGAAGSAAPPAEAPGARGEGPREDRLAPCAPAGRALRPRPLGRQGHRSRRFDPARRRGSGDDRRHAQAGRPQRRGQDQRRRRRRVSGGRRPKRRSANSRARPRRSPATWTRARRSRRRRRSARCPSARSKRAAPNSTAALKARRPQREDLVHASDRVRDRASRERAARHVRVVPPRERQAAARRTRASTSASPSTRSAKTVRARWSCR